MANGAANTTANGPAPTAVQASVSLWTGPSQRAPTRASNSGHTGITAGLAGPVEVAHVVIAEIPFTPESGFPPTGRVSGALTGR